MSDSSDSEVPVGLMDRMKSSPPQHDYLLSTQQSFDRLEVTASTDQFAKPFIQAMTSWCITARSELLVMLLTELSELVQRCQSLFYNGKEKSRELAIEHFRLSHRFERLDSMSFTTTLPKFRVQTSTPKRATFAYFCHATTRTPSETWSVCLAWVCVKLTHGSIFTRSSPLRGALCDAVHPCHATLPKPRPNPS